MDSSSCLWLAITNLLAITNELTVDSQTLCLSNLIIAVTAVVVLIIATSDTAPYVNTTLCLLSKLGFVIQCDKTILKPIHKIEFIGFHIDSVGTGCQTTFCLKKQQQQRKPET